ncbi:hypothetical protein [Aliikangiella sp. IMCC44359]|uniref:hypothetical protein n=1 Tax=Aliikangiella sp. IMCC44359 TaxID=3459125 RepID=UPI00403AE770
MFARLLLSFIVIFSYPTFGKNIPDELAKWSEWVKYEQTYRTCPSLNGVSSGNKKNHLCAWPGVMELSVSERQAHFKQFWQLFDESQVPLPGSRSYWPQNVKVNGQTAVVLQQGNTPYILLPKGLYTIEGNVLWSKRPESLPIPTQVALLDVSINGVRQPFISYSKNQSQVWLGSVKKAQVKEKDFLKLRVNRLISDGHPMEMNVVINLEVSGRVREQKLTRFSTHQYQLMSVSSILNTRIDSQGDLWVQMKPGNFRIQLNFKVHHNPESISLDQVGDSWPEQEIWAYQNNERLRSTQISGVSPIDSEQGFMSEWKNFPHYVVNHQEALTIKERQRGMSHNFDSLSLERQIWLSFDNQTFYFFDTIKGQKTKDWRVSTIENYQLTQLSNHGKERLITYDDKQRTGAEVRTRTINIEASGEVDVDNMQHASGWDIPFANTRVVMHIPPGRKVINISGSDSVNGDWISRWKLIDLFFVLVTTALVFKFFGIWASVLALVTLVLGYHEANMPMFWWFNFVAALSLALKVTHQKLTQVTRVYQWVSLAILIIFLFPFLAEQIRFTLHPQLEMNQSLESGNSRYSVKSPPISNFVAKQSEVREEVLEDALELKSQRLSKPKKVTVTGSRIQQTSLDTSYEQDAVIQAGKGKPNWHWQHAGYSWNGPIEGTENVSITLLSEIWVKVLRVMLIIFSILLLLVLLNRNVIKDEKFKKIFSGSIKASLLFIGVIGITLLGAYNQPLSAADYPNEKLLKELQSRIYPQPLCEPECISVSNINMQVNELNIKLVAEYQSGALKAALLPKSDDWRIKQVILNQKVVKSLWQNQQGAWILLPEGLSTVVIKASLKDKSNISLYFPEYPKRVVYDAIGWDVSGVNLNHLLSDSVQLTRQTTNVSSIEFAQSKAGKDNVKQAQEQSINNLLLVTRFFKFSNEWRLTTSVTRKAPLIGTITTELPLLSYEKPLQMVDSIKDGKMQIVIPNNQQSVSWDSSIHGEQSFELIALDDNEINESWKILVYPSWNLQIKGIPQVAPDYVNDDDFWVYQYFPRAGEKLSVMIRKPPAVKGDSLAITSASQEFNISKRKTTTDLSINYRATRAETLLLHVGETAVKNLRHDGSQVNVGNVDGILSIALKPGEHQIELLLESGQAISKQLKLIGVSLNREFTNLTTKVNLPDSRWLIYASGPGYGPAIIYWGELIFFILLAIGLSKLSFSPLNYWQWLVLGMGMSTYSWPAMVFVSIWLLASEWRRKNQQQPTQYKVMFAWITLLSTIAAVLVLISAVPNGLLETPDMGVVGNGSYTNSLVWFLDRGTNILGETVVYSLPIWIYKGLMLIWATWLSFSLIKWIGWIGKDLSNVQLIKVKKVEQAKPKSDIQQGSENHDSKK